VLLNSLQYALYRILEGYYFPDRVASLLERFQLWRKRRLIRQIGTKSSRSKLALRIERLTSYPPDDEIRPTRLGNSIRAIETYGYNRFELDTQALWIELYALAPDALRDEQDHARASVDLFVCLTYLSALLGVCSLADLGFTSGGLSDRLLIVGLSAVLLVPFWYRMAIESTRYWFSAVRAVVNVERRDLSTQLGLQIPLELEDERKMWRRVNWLVNWEYNPHIADELRPFRSSPAPDERGSA